MVNEDYKFDLVATLKQTIKSPPFFTYTIMIGLMLLGFTIPEMVFSLITPFAQANAFLSMLMIGLSLSFYLDKDKVKRMIALLVTRFSIGGLIGFAFYQLPMFDLELRQAMLVILLSPLPSLAPMFTEKIKGDHEFSAIVTSCSIVASLISISTLLMFWYF